MTGLTSPRKVLLTLREGHLEPRLFTSAVALCKRLDAGMEILLAAPEQRTPPELEEFLDTLRETGLPYTLQRKPGLQPRDIIDYANSHESITAVLIDSPEGWETPAKHHTGNPWRRLACPLVTAAIH